MPESLELFPPPGDENYEPMVPNTSWAWLPYFDAFAFIFTATVLYIGAK